MPKENEINKIKNLASKGKSVNQIKDKLDIPKSTVYYYFKKEVGQKQKENRLEIPNDEEIKGELCGVFGGDGSFYKDSNYHYMIRFHLNYRDKYWKILVKFLKENLEKKPLINNEPRKSKANLRYNSKLLHKFFEQRLSFQPSDKSGTICISQKLEPSRKFKIGFLRGLIDTDGHTSKEKRRTRFNTISSSLAKDTSRFLSDIGIKNWTSHEPDKRDNCRDMYRTQITGESAILFNNLIDPRNPKKNLKQF